MLRPRPHRVANRERKGKKEKGSEWEKEEIEERKRGQREGGGRERVREEFCTVVIFP